MSHYHHCPSALGKIADNSLYLCHVGRVESTRRLVQKYHFRVHRQGAGYRCPLLLSSGQFVRILQLASLKAHSVQMLHGCIVGFLLRSSEYIHLRDHQILYHCQMREEVELLEHHTHPASYLCKVLPVRRDVFSVEQYLPSGRTVNHVYAVQKSGLARTGRSYDRDDIAVVYNGVHIFERRRVLILLFKVYKLYHLRFTPFSMSSRFRLFGSNSGSILFAERLISASRTK